MPQKPNHSEEIRSLRRQLHDELQAYAQGTFTAGAYIITWAVTHLTTEQLEEIRDHLEDVYGFVPTVAQRKGDSE